MFGYEDMLQEKIDMLMVVYQRSKDLLNFLHDKYENNNLDRYEELKSLLVIAISKFERSSNESKI